MTPEKLKVAVIGAGRMGLFHLKKFLELSDRCDLVGFYDPTPAHAQAVESQIGRPAFSDLTRLLFEADAVVVASPTETHYVAAREALNAGVHVLVEKPMTPTLEQAIELDELARKKNLILQVGFLERYRCRALLGTFPARAPYFIDAHRLSVTVGREPSVDVVADLMIHDLDLALSLVKAEPVRIAASGAKVMTDYWDLASARLEFLDGSVVNLSASRVSPAQQRTFKVYAGPYAAHLDFVDNSADVGVRRRGESDTQRRRLEGMDALKEQAIEFLNSIRENRAPLVTAADGIRSLKYSLTIREHLRANPHSSLHPSSQAEVVPL